MMRGDESLLKSFAAFINKVVPLLDNQEIETFVSKSSSRTFRKKEVFISEGEVCNRLIFIHRGLFRYYYILPDGNELTKDFAIDRQNPFCTSYTSFITKKPSKIWIEALEDSLVWIWDEAYVMPLFNQHASWVLFAKKMAEILFIRKEQREESFLLLTPEERYEEFLNKFPGLDQRIPQYHIASYLGLTPESLSRIRKRLVHRKVFLGYLWP